MGTRARIVVLPKDSTDLHIEELELPDPEPNQVEVRQFASGICHSQLHQIQRTRVNNLFLGHESTGVVGKVGSNVTHVREGDIVLVTWVPRNAAQADAPPASITLQTSVGRTWTKNVFTWADVTLADQQFVVKVNPDTARDVSSIVGCAVMTGAGAVVNTANVQAGDSVAIIGVGGVGLSAVAAARIVGASPIIAVDLDDKKLEFARQFGATHTINARTENPVEVVHALTEQQGAYTFQDALVSGADYTFDCIGLNDTMTQAITACRKGQVGVRTGGAAVLVGLPTDVLQLNAMEILISERSLLGSNCGSCTPDRDIPRFLEWHNSHKLDLDALVTRRYKLDDINDAVAELAAGEIRGRAIIEF